ncbi:MAG: hypothetical protein WA322_16860, partial [Pseudolabrys sp.]
SGCSGWRGCVAHGGATLRPLPQLLWFEVTRHPTAEWLARQVTDAPLRRAVQRSGVIVAIPFLAGLFHQYVRI